MSFVTRGFQGRDRDNGPSGRVPPGQYATLDFPVLSAGPTPQISTDDWFFTRIGADGKERRWSWSELMELPTESVTVDIHCVTKWSKLDTNWTGISLEHLLADVASRSGHALFTSYGGYTTNLPIEDVTDGKAWIAFEYDGEPLAPEHGGPARLLVPHLYLWKSAKWVNGVRLSETIQPGFWESYGYHIYGDPWREQRYAGD